MTERAQARRRRVLGLELALLEAEVNLLEELIRAGIMPEGARRQPTAHELRAGVRFAELDRLVLEAAALIGRKVDRVRDHVLDGLALELADAFGEPDPYAVLARLDEFRDPTSGRVLPGLRELIDDVSTEVRDDLLATARAGAAEALDEGRRQGLPDRLIPDVDPIDPEVEAAATAHAQRAAKAPAERLLAVAAEAGARAATAAGATGGDVLSAALDAAENASRAGQEDAARQAANVAHGLGRTRALRQLPTPREVYASELLDGNTCGPCATVDGRTYQSLEDALIDYPGAGGFVGCDGGARCRGTLVLVHETEAAPTLDNPGAGPGSPGGPADRTPRGPASNAPAPATGPLEPDRGMPQPSDTDYAQLGDDGRTTMPVEDLEEPVTTVAPDAVDRDPELARMSDDDLDRLLVDDAEPIERRMMAADELDHRAAGNRAQVWDEEELDAETLARYDAEREAWEAAGGYAADATYGLGRAVTSKPQGRAIDRVRAEWSEQLEYDYLAAEDATRGSLVRRDRAAEYRAKYGTSVAPLMEGPARVAYYYASRELRDHWESIGGRKSFAEFAVDRGILDAKTRKRAATAAQAREEARQLAEQSAERKARRKAARDARRRPLSAGERLEREQRRRDRIKARERRLQAEAGYLEPPQETP